MPTCIELSMKFLVNELFAGPVTISVPFGESKNNKSLFPLDNAVNSIVRKSLSPEGLGDANETAL